MSEWAYPTTSHYSLPQMWPLKFNSSYKCHSHFRWMRFGLISCWHFRWRICHILRSLSILKDVVNSDHFNIRTLILKFDSSQGLPKTRMLPKRGSHRINKSGCPVQRKHTPYLYLISNNKKTWHVGLRKNTFTLSMVGENHACKYRIKKSP